MNAGQIALELQKFLGGQRRQLTLLVLLCVFGLLLEGQLVEGLCPGSGHFRISKQLLLRS